MKGFKTASLTQSLPFWSIQRPEEPQAPPAALCICCQAFVTQRAKQGFSVVSLLLPQLPPSPNQSRGWGRRPGPSWPQGLLEPSESCPSRGESAVTKQGSRAGNLLRSWQEKQLSQGKSLGESLNCPVSHNPLELGGLCAIPGGSCCWKRGVWDHVAGFQHPWCHCRENSPGSLASG